MDSLELDIRGKRASGSRRGDRIHVRILFIDVMAKFLRPMLDGAWKNRSEPAMASGPSSLTLEVGHPVASDLGE